ncbi:MAG TPA: ATP-dependent DNA helicase PcrA, partial [candidate division WWE3 bacterium]|nr:ATP-dependent DNA helicase PcrA [candidate division WWE3 bacterium]
ELEQLEEERRLYYVGITRAKELLHITFARHRSFFGSTKQSLVSRFISELPEENIESLNSFDTSDLVDIEEVEDFFGDLGL